MDVEKHIQIVSNRIDEAVDLAGQIEELVYPLGVQLHALKEALGAPTTGKALFDVYKSLSDTVIALRARQTLLDKATNLGKELDPILKALDKEKK